MDGKLWRVGVKVADYERAVTFYRDSLGLKIVQTMEEKPDQKACFFDLVGTLFYVIWDRPKDGEAPPPGKNRARIDVAVPDVGATWKQLEGRVAESKGPPHPTRFGRAGFSVRDPEGTTIHFFQDANP